MIIMLMEYVADEKIDWNQFFIGAIFTIIMFININHFIIGFSMEMIYLIFSLGYLTSYMKQLIDEMKQWQSIWNRRMAIFQYNIRRQYLRHYNEMINFNNMHCNFLMFIEIMSKSLVLIIVIACGKTMNLSINSYFMIIVFIMTFIYAEIVFIVISRFPKNNEKFFKMFYDWNAKNQSNIY
ncbi:hypothetical protein HUG17_9182 [Dermatophagoides farinae]|uniref:Uncharacterized protein n=1 Tax=Dermatophagoides farinae TaxID=6954 RepID=A0A9D4SDJ8_DERFA|nr:hypothetical protein HUG17_9182 [Dermatophagoides farinae]